MDAIKRRTVVEEASLDASEKSKLMYFYTNPGNSEKTSIKDELESGRPPFTKLKAFKALMMPHLYLYDSFRGWSYLNSNE